MHPQETELIDYDELEKSAIKFKPKLIIAGYSAYSRLLDFARFREIADKVNKCTCHYVVHELNGILNYVINSQFR